YFREKWLVDRLANTVAAAFGDEPRVQIHQDRAYLAVVLAGPRLHDITTFPAPPTRVLAYRQPHTASPARLLQRDASVVPATDDWPFLYMRKPGLPQHYAIALPLLGLIALNYWIPVGRVAFDSRAATSLFYGALVFSPVFCAGLLFSRSFRRSSAAAGDFGANLLGAMVGGVGEYFSLISGY